MARCRRQNDFINFLKIKMKLKSLLWYIKVEIMNLFLYPNITKYKSIDYEKYWKDRLQKRFKRL